MIKYLFVDGAYLQERLSAFGEYWFREQVGLNYNALGAGFQKVFYYDCLPAKNDKESDLEYQHRVSQKELFFDRLRKIDGWHVIEGVSKRRRKGPASQKEVDILIAVDMLTHSYRKNMDRLAFIAGDQDFRPLVEAIVRDGMYVELWYDPRSISKDLKDAADARIELNFFLMHSFLEESFRAAHPLPERSGFGEKQIPPETLVTERGFVGDEVVALLWKRPNSEDYYISATCKFDGFYPQLRLASDPELLKRVFATYYVEPEWKAA